jgi:ankyrin repeat protein
VKRFAACIAAAVALIGPASAQVEPSADERAAYRGLLAAAAKGDVDAAKTILDQGETPNARDPRGRTALHIAVHLRHRDLARVLLERGADPNALEFQRYDPVTIAAVGNDSAMLKLLLAAGADPRNVTSPYAGTALIAAAHLGHVEAVEVLIAAGAPLDHINNLGWTALIEAVVLGDGGPRHTAIVKLLLDAGASARIGDRNGATPLALATQRGFRPMQALLERATR